MSAHTRSVFFFKQKTAYEMRISDWSSDVCSSDLVDRRPGARRDDGAAAFAREFVRAAEPDPLRPAEDERDLVLDPQVHQGAFPCWSLSRSCRMSFRPGDAATVEPPSLLIVVPVI